MNHRLLTDDFPYADDVLADLHALVCGASQGIGRATALMLARAGADVTVIARDEAALSSLCDEMAEIGTADFRWRSVDMEDTEALEELVAGLTAEFGPIQILINNSGGPPGGPLLANDVADFEAPFRRHLHAAHTITKILSYGMERSGMGRIVNIMSTSVREPIDNLGLSNTLRSAMAAWSKSLSRELAPCITINNILPGFTDTARLASLANSISERTGKSVDEIEDAWLDSVPIERLVDPMETAAAITWLCLPASGAIRGVSLAVDGGRMRSI
jgi:3-oxoacyl-[acyl-carrier protein] reductase